MTDTTYNGWTNYETWAVNLWLDTVRKCTTDALRNGGMTDEEIAKEMSDFND